MRSGALLGLAGVVVAGGARAQCTPAPDRFCVTVVAPQQYAVNGTPRLPLALTRGVTYTFQMVNVAGVHPFALSATAEGPGALLTLGVSGPNPASGTQTITFTPGPMTPDVVFYRCVNHFGMGARIDIQDPCCVDFNGDTELDFSDIERFLAALAAMTPGDCAPGADFNNDGEFDFSDIERFLALYGAGC